MFCRNCGKDLAGTPEVCINCGAKPMAGTGFCPGCGAPTTALTEVCTNCGARVARAIKKKTWKPIAAGIICIIVGGSFAMVFTPLALADLFAGTEGWRDVGFNLMFIILGIIPIVGGIYALRRRVWALALVGSICTLILEIIMTLFLIGALSEGRGLPPPWRLVGSSVVFGIPGILAIIFVSLGKREFE